MVKRNIFKIFIILAILMVGYGFFYPLLRYPYEAANPWPEAYQVIQKEIINQQKVPPDYMVQFGEKQPTDMTYFLNHHLMNVSFKLLDGAPFELNERFLSVVLTLFIFLSAYLFFTKAFGLYRGTLMSIMFLFLPRNMNYYTNINGEYLSLIILFLSLYFTFDWLYYRKKKSLYVGLFLAAVLPILCLINIGVYCIIVFSYGVSSWLTAQKRAGIFKRYVGLFLLLFAFVVFVALPPLLMTGNIASGASSSIGSLYRKRDAKEIEFEKKYYEDFATYGRSFYNFPVLTRDIYYDSLDGSKIGYFNVYYIFLALIGLMLFLNGKKQDRELTFGVVLAGVFILLEAFLYSKFFNDNIYNSALRFLLYFSLPIIIIASVGLDKLSAKKPYILLLYIASIFLAAVPIIRDAVHSTNMYEALYAQPYKDVLAWAELNIPDKDYIISNEWANGEFYVKANKLDRVESGKASATYSTYTHIYELLNSTKKILSNNSTPEETASLIQKENIKYIILWNRPAAYEIYPQAAAEIKFDKMPFLEKVFTSRGVTPNGYQASASIYRVKTWQL